MSFIPQLLIPKIYLSVQYSQRNSQLAAHHSSESQKAAAKQYRNCQAQEFAQPFRYQACPRVHLPVRLEVKSISCARNEGRVSDWPGEDFLRFLKKTCKCIVGVHLVFGSYKPGIAKIYALITAIGKQDSLVRRNTIHRHGNVVEEEKRNVFEILARLVRCRLRRQTKRNNVIGVS